MNKPRSRHKKLLLPAVALALIVGLGVWFLQPGSEVVSTAEKQASAPAKRQPPNPKFPTANDVTDGRVSKRAFANYGAETTSMEDDLKLVDGLIRKFYRFAKDQSNRFPMGTNREITRVLAGHNPMQRAWISADHPAIDDRGELTDRWNTPLHFHALARGVFEIRSAGPDGKIFTGDDIVHGRNRTAQQAFTTVSGSEGEKNERSEEN